MHIQSMQAVVAKMNQRMFAGADQLFLGTESALRQAKLFLLGGLCSLLQLKLQLFSEGNSQA